MGSRCGVCLSERGTYGEEKGGVDVVFACQREVLMGIKNGESMWCLPVRRQ